MWPYILGAIALTICYFVYSFFSSFGYNTVDNQMVYKYYDNANYRSAYRKMPDADPDKFISFGPHKDYGKDDRKVYVKGNVISESDPNTFEIVDKRNHYAKDANHVYYYSRKISDRPNAFTSFKNGYAKDDQHVFNGGGILAKANPNTFEFLNEDVELARDDQHVYRNGKLLEGSHSPTFENIAFHYYRDRNNVYHRSKKVIGAKPSTIEVLGDRYARDNFFVYYESRRLLDADPASFRVIVSKDGDYYAADKYRKYWYDKEVEEFPERLMAEAQ